MNQLHMHQALYALLRNSNRVASDAVAVRWLFANLMSNAKDYDLFFRLQILEGALGVREGVWWTKGRAGLKEAQKVASSFNLNSDWLEPGNTGMFKILHNQIENTINRLGVSSINADDIIQSALMGLGDTLGSVKKPAYEAGKVNAKKIQEGKETPRTISAGVLTKWIGRKIFINIRKLEQTVEKGVDTLPSHKDIREDSENFLFNIVFKDLNNPAGKKIRDFMRKTWKGTGQQEAMDLWLDMIENRKTPKKHEMAKLLGISPQSFSKNWVLSWKNFFRSFKRNTPLIKLLDSYFAREGFEFEFPNSKYFVKNFQ